MIKSFIGEYQFLSNFYPCIIKDDLFTGVTYPSVENAYQACKSTDPEFWQALRECSAGKAKRLGRSIKPRADWRTVNLGLMEYLVKVKFTPMSVLSFKLLETGDEELIEGNTWGDKFFGRILNTDGTLGEGENHLGEILMKVRGQLQVIMHTKVNPYKDKEE